MIWFCDCVFVDWSIRDFADHMESCKSQINNWYWRSILTVFYNALSWKSDFVRTIYQFTLIFKQSINQFKNSYVIKWSVEFFWIFEKNKNITSINTLHFWLKSMQMFSLWLIKNSFLILLFLINLYVKKFFLSTAFSKNSV